MTVKKLLNGNWFIQVFVIGQDPAALRLSDLTKRCCNSSTRCHCKKKKYSYYNRMKGYVSNFSHNCIPTLNVFI